MIDNITDIAVEGIRSAIVQQAAIDWLKAQADIYLYSDVKRGRAYIEKWQKKKLTWDEIEKKRCDRLEAAYITRGECEIFFRSKWYQKLCSLDGEKLVEMLKVKAKSDDEASKVCATKRFKGLCM